MTRWLFYLRSFFPSWVFFNDITRELRLEVRYGKDEYTLGEWSNALPAIQRSLANIFINPDGSYLHACQNNLAHLNLDIEIYAGRPDEVAQLATYQITKNLAQFQINKIIAKPFHYQFRLLARVVSNKTEDVILTSLVYEG